MSDEIVRRTLPDGAIVIESPRCSFRYRRPRRGLVHVCISGRDDGQFGGMPMDELAPDLQRFAPVELFVDVTEALAPAVVVQDAWAEWFGRHRAQLSRVSILATGKYMQFTAEIVKFFSRTGELIRVYLDPAAFADALARASAAPPRR